MAKHSVFRDFIGRLRIRWRTELPFIRPIEETLGPALPKASTFYAGFTPRLGMHVFVNFQHSSKSWQVGQFTVNLILSKRKGVPDAWGGPFAPDKGGSFSEGCYRISFLLGRNRDKWWHLKQDDAPIGTDAWRAVTYDDYVAVLTDAATDATHDVREALAMLGVNG